jgi:hypothetical protein
VSARQDITYVTGDDRGTADEFKSLCSAWLPVVIPADMRVTVVRCRAKELHDRFLLTDRGGLTIGQGLDEAGEKEEIQEVRMTILDKATVDQLWNDYTGPRPKYARELDGAVVVMGRKRV